MLTKPFRPETAHTSGRLPVTLFPKEVSIAPAGSSAKSAQNAELAAPAIAKSSQTLAKAFAEPTPPFPQSEASFA